MHEKKEKFARIDHPRVERCGFPEFVYGAGKTVDQLKSIIEEIKASKQSVLVTRLAEDAYEKLKKRFPEAKYDALSKTFFILRNILQCY